MSLRQMARQYVIDSVTECATKSHEQDYNKLHVWRDGTVSWSESFSKSDDIIDRQASDFRAVESVACVGTGSLVCNCPHCDLVGTPNGYTTQAEAVRDSIGEYGTGDVEEGMLAEFDAIPAGYFDDEEVN